MLRTMMFVDYQNFRIALDEAAKKSGKKYSSIDYVEFGNQITKIIPFENQVIKRYIFAYRPCDELMELDYYKNYYKWLTGLKRAHYTEVIEGRQEIRYIEGTEFDIHDRRTYTTVEKETDINLATHMVSKAFQNAFDIAILVSGDTDYTSVVKSFMILER